MEVEEQDKISIKMTNFLYCKYLIANDRILLNKQRREFR